MVKRSEDPRFELMPLQELLDRRHPDNAKDHDLGLIVESLKKHGLGRKPSVNEVDGKLFYGHGTTEALEIMFKNGDAAPDQVTFENGDWLIPVERGKRLPKKLASSYRLVDNKATEAGGWLEPQLIEVLMSLDDLTATGFDGDDLDQLIEITGYELDWDEAFGKLPTGPESDYRQMTFVLHQKQWKIVDRAIKLGRENLSARELKLNQNRNGSALAAVCKAFIASQA